VLIDAKNRYYGFDLCPGFWDALLTAHEACSVYSLDHVRDELLSGEDDLKSWVEQLPDGFFLPSTSVGIAEGFRQMQSWAHGSPQFTDAAKMHFARCADGWLVAAAMVHHAKVVTLETFNPDIKKAIKIPNVARQFRVECVDTFEMLKSLRTSFALRRAGDG
jgi:hypothetical protein